MALFDESLSAVNGIFLLLALGLALGFEFVNGFHDTANAVATVIYTHSLRPMQAVVWSGVWNFIGVLMSSGAVAFGIITLLPVELVLNVGSGTGFAMVFGLLISAILWNVGTWYMGLPASSSHALIGSIMGVGLANSMLTPGRPFGEGVNWVKAGEVGIALMVSPAVGFVCAAALLLVMKFLVKSKALYESPKKEAPPPVWIRILLILTCTGVSWGHGSNDGQKGMGLIMLILIGILPTTYAVNQRTTKAEILDLIGGARTVSIQMERHSVAIADGSLASSDEIAGFLKPGAALTDRVYSAIAVKCREVVTLLQGRESLESLSPEERKTLRKVLYLTSEALGKVDKGKKLTDPAEVSAVGKLKKRMDGVTKFIPDWVKAAVAIALGLGTTIGWKRIVVTVGEKIGKTHLSYGQGAVAELVAAATILVADKYGLPVSTTHVLSSGVAGTMAANRSGLQMETLRNLLLAWVLTLPVTVVLGAGLFAFVLNVLLRLGIK